MKNIKYSGQLCALWEDKGQKVRGSTTTEAKLLTTPQFSEFMKGKAERFLAKRQLCVQEKGCGRGVCVSMYMTRSDVMVINKSIQRKYHLLSIKIWA